MPVTVHPAPANGTSVALPLTETAPLPSFEKLATNPLFTQADTDFDTITWLWVMKTEGVFPDALGAYYLYFSTDHSPSLGGIALAYSDNPLGPWTQHGQVYVDTVSGRQTETPSVLPKLEPNTGAYLYYQQLAVGGTAASQVTVRASTPDGLTFTRNGIALNVEDTAGIPGPTKHTGYFRPFRIGHFTAGYHLLSSGDYSEMGMSLSNDGGETFVLDPRPLGNSTDATGVNDKRFAWIGATPFYWHGQLWVLGNAREFGNSGGGSVSVRRWHIAPLAADGRSVIGPFIDVSAPDQTWEEGIVSGPQSLLVENDKLYIFYIGAGAAGGVGVAVSS